MTSTEVVYTLALYFIGLAAVATVALVSASKKRRNDRIRDKSSDPIAEITNIVSMGDVRLAKLSKLIIEAEDQLAKGEHDKFLESQARVISEAKSVVSVSSKSDVIDEAS